MLLLLVLLALPAGAQVPEGPSGVGVAPAPGSRYASSSGTFVELGTVALGRAVTGEVVLRNQGSEASRVLLYASDALPSQGGGFGFSERSAPDTQVGSWLVLDRAEVTVPPRGEVRAGYRVLVPTGTEGGEYVGGVVAEPSVPEVTGGLQTSTRVAMAVYLTVPGGSPGATPGRGRPDGTLELTRLSTRTDGSKVCPVVSYRNESQKVLDPSAEVVADGVLSSSSYRRARTGAVLPGSQAEVVLPCLDRPVGPSTLRVRLKTSTGLLEDQSRDLYLPWPVGLALLLLLLLVLAVVTTYLRGRRSARSAEPVAEPPSPL
ncbi:MAG: putative protein of unknown function cell surface [Frankiales bacterium]|nr:putative protein of unknown function cell surface [Frankiales bacterium]